jgi:hypothetical protein
MTVTVLGEWRKVYWADWPNGAYMTGSTQVARVRQEVPADLADRVHLAHQVVCVLVSLRPLDATRAALSASASVHPADPLDPRCLAVHADRAFP